MMNKLWAMLFICGTDHERFEYLLVDWRKAYANKQQDLYPDDLYTMLDLMLVMLAKKKKKPGNGNNSGNKESSKKEETPDESSFATKGSEAKKEVQAHTKWNCCGDNHYAGDCGK